MLNQILTDKKHTLSELRTLRMQGRSALDSVELLVQRQNSVYLAQKLVVSNLTKNTKEHELASSRLNGMKDMLDVSKTYLEQIKAKLELLDKENEETKKNKKNKDENVNIPIVEENIQVTKEQNEPSPAVESVGLQGDGS